MLLMICVLSLGIEERDLLERSYHDYLEGSESVIIKGRLRVNVNFWESIDASQFVLSVIKEGYKIPFYYTPKTISLPCRSWFCCGVFFSAGGY